MEKRCRQAEQQGNRMIYSKYRNMNFMAGERAGSHAGRWHEKRIKRKILIRNDRLNEWLLSRRFRGNREGKKKKKIGNVNGLICEGKIHFPQISTWHSWRLRDKQEDDRIKHSTDAGIEKFGKVCHNVNKISANKIILINQIKYI